jgi:hypothetical protein
VGFRKKKTLAKQFHQSAIESILTLKRSVASLTVFFNVFSEFWDFCVSMDASAFGGSWPGL